SGELNAIGGYAETLLFASLLFVLTSWLVLSFERSSSVGIRFSGRQQIHSYVSRSFWRQAAYFAWGLITGLALWSNQLILPIIAMIGLVLLVFCWREIFGFVREGADAKAGTEADADE